MALPRNPLTQLVPQRVRHVRDQLGAGLFVDQRPLAVTGGPVTPDPTPLRTAKRQRFSPVERGEFFGPEPWGMRWFKLRIPAPRTGEAGRRVLQWRSNGETTAWIDGVPWAGLDGCHQYCPLPDRAATLYLATGTWQTGIWGPGYHGLDPVGGCRFLGADLALRDEARWRAYHDMDVLVRVLDRLLADADIAKPGHHGYAEPLFAVSPLIRVLVAGLDRVADAYDGAGLDAVQAALDELYARVRGRDDLRGTAAIIGHGHLDLVWLWPEVATKHKAVHTTATLMRLWERYPEMTYSGTQIPWYDAVAEASPRLLEQVQERIAAGQWEASGAMEVEADVTLPSGEGLARSLLYGQRAFAALRGGEACKMLWIPDVFGYSACLPQLMRQAGVEWFYTTKLHWSAVTRFPHTSFVWRGNDGSEVVTHISPRDYNGVMDPGDLMSNLRKHQQVAVHDELLLPQGRGDGGGGPSEDMCERARRLADLAGVPRTRWTTGEAFFRRLAKRRAELPVFQGELYLEYHRGTYTTQGRFKLAYRRAEQALLAREAVRAVHGREPLAYADWKRVCFAQFHDAIPGSSITRVYQEMNPELEAIAADQRAAAQRELGGGRGRSLRVFNPVALPLRTVVELESDEFDRAGDVTTLVDEDGRTWPVQEAADGRMAVALEIDSLGSQTLRPAVDAEPAAELTARSTRIANERCEARFSRQGQLQALTIDGEPLALHGAGFELYADNPANFDAWDIDRGAMALGQACAERTPLRVVENGPVRAVLEGRARIGDASELIVRYSLAAGDNMLAIECEVDWRERHRLLKYHVRSDYRGRQVRYGAPFGSVTRPQQAGFPNEESQWEVAGQRWAAVTDDDDHGLALVTEAKYGFSCRDGDLGLSLLRAPTEPDPEADQGRHRIRFALGRHRARSDGDGLSTAAEAEARYAEPLTVRGGGGQSAPFALHELGSLVPAAVKPAEDGDGVVIRLHETIGARGEARLACRQHARRVELVDLLERPRGRLLREVGGEQRYRIAYRPYEIISIRLRWVP